ncbi:DUF1090 family protein [Xenorhabdus ishibashii]|uniref:Uncharacterized protein n=1 Tax=Xenorhabdus ishibashii TaxID=1034471 RepID=A0A2D0KGV1_9GAMM|nr:DUF1090 family protein [Xenorhabdus ishibashii]PHM62653.1 hypothetical protein Xish_01863 [Xenorhabdus ishibashii]
MMSKTLILSVLIVFSMSAAYANQGKMGCEIKKKTLEKQLRYAQADKDEHLIKGLARALENIKTTCALEEFLQEQNNKSETAKDNAKNNTTGNSTDKNSSPSLKLKQPSNKNQSRKSSKSNKVDIRKNKENSAGHIQNTACI